jgi:hypothetical protein
MAIALDDAERDVLLAHGIAVFEDRPILDSPGPIDADSTSEIESRIGGRIPKGLVALWSASFGGRLDYVVRCEIEGVSIAFAFQELFSLQPGSYRDLLEWIDHEEIAAADAAEEAGTAPGPLEYLPFGGFEYLDRFAVKLTGDDRGAVYAWKLGLAESSTLTTEADVRVRIADDVRSFFRALMFERDPLGEAKDFEPGLDLVSMLAELAADGPSGASAAQKLREALAAQTLDWRPALAAGTIGRDPRLCDLALEAAAGRNDVATLERLGELGVDVTLDRSAAVAPLEIALAAGSNDVVRYLLDRAVDVTRTIPVAATHASPELLAELLLRGGEPSAHAALAAAADGAAENAALIARAYLARTSSALESLVTTALGWAARADENAMRVETRRAPSARDAASYRKEAEALRRFAALAPTLAAPREDSTAATSPPR